MLTINPTVRQNENPNSYPNYSVTVDYFYKGFQFSFIIVLNITTKPNKLTNGVYSVYTSTGDTISILEVQYWNLTEEKVINGFKKAIKHYINDYIHTIIKTKK